MSRITNIVELRQHLAERFPQLRSGSDPLIAGSRAAHSEISFADLVSGNLRMLTELVQEHPSTGSSLILSALIRRLCPAHWVALVDGHDSFDPSEFDNDTLSRLLWVRCRSTDEALRATDLLLRDRNLPFVLLDLALAPVQHLRKIPSSTWHRFHRIIEHASSALLVILPCHLVSCAQAKFVLDASFELNALSQSESELLHRLQVRSEQKLFAAAHDRQDKVAHAG